MTATIGFNCTLHECAHACALLLSGSAEVGIRYTGDGLHWEVLACGGIPHDDFMKRSCMAGFLVLGSVSYSDREGLSRIDPAERPALSEWVLANVKPALASLDPQLLTRLAAQLVKDGEVWIINQPGLPLSAMIEDSIP